MISYDLKKISETVNGTLLGDPEVRIKGVHFDSRAAREGMLFAPIIGEKVDGHSFVADLLKKGIAASFWQKDDPLPVPEGNIIIVDDVQTALQALAADYRRTLSCHFIGVTGSSGKTSTKDIVSSVVSRKYRTCKTFGNQNNDLGVPLTVMNVDDDAEYVVAEMGINDIGVMDRLVTMVQPEITVISSIGPAHIAQLGSMDGIVEQKCLINRDLGDGQCFYNQHSYGLKEHLQSLNLHNRPIGYGFEEDCDIRAEDYCLNDEGTSFSCRGRSYSLPILGRHQVLNALAAIGIGEKLGIEYEQIREGLACVQLTPHRLQLKKIRDAVIIDDSYNCNPSSLVASLQMVRQYNRSYHKTVVIGDMLELGETSPQLHSGIADEIDFRQFDQIVLVGREVEALAANLASQGIAYRLFTDNAEVRQYLLPYLKKGNVLFFKASNGMHFASLIDSLEE
ncbi:MAG: UDP-N-acetylmuramoyl-tripeptide--D-alanyl-D-alanine ligase [Erysipelotrichaceae bacterium]|nr:UDP-N-acetylmuramoyl-tripeptide--D-alanyl-D-alanine ligase [Erysipelotrichaceae bacterium]